MAEADNLRHTRIALNNGSGAIPALGFGTLIPDPVATTLATKAALEAGFRQLDAAERYRNEKEVGDAVQEVFKAGKIKREDVFNSNSTTSISISSTPPLPSSLETSKTRGMRTAM